MSGNVPTLAFLVKSGLSVTSVDNHNRKPRNVAFSDPAVQFLSQCEQGEFLRVEVLNCTYRGWWCSGFFLASYAGGRGFDSCIRQS